MVDFDFSILGLVFRCKDVFDLREVQALNLLSDVHHLSRLQHRAGDDLLQVALISLVGHVVAQLGSLRKPGVGEGLIGGDTLGRILIQALANQVLSLVAHVLEAIVFKSELSDLHSGDNLSGVFSWERHLAGKEDIEDHSHRPDVALGSVRFVEDLRGDVEQLNRKVITQITTYRSVGS
jgi:hypothetical protein